MILPDPPLLLITDRRQAALPLLEIVEAALVAGCRWISLREKDMSATARLGLLRNLIDLGRGWDAVIAVHGDLAAAHMVGADGIHLPAKTSPARARRLLGAKALIGLSAHGPEEMTAAATEGADYVTLSPVFVSHSKPGYGPALGIERLAQAVAAAPLPVVALGGIGPEQARDCLAAGAAGIAVMGGVMRANDPARVVASLLAAFPTRPCPGGRQSKPSRRDRRTA